MICKTEDTPPVVRFPYFFGECDKMKLELVDLAKQIDLKSAKKDFAPYYSYMGYPAVPVRKMVGYMVLKHMYDKSDEAFVDRRIENPYWKCFCGETYFQFEKPFDPSEFLHFHNSQSTDAAERLLKLIVSLFEKKKVEEKEVLVDTTIQEKNITFPTDAKPHKKIIEGCWKIVEKEGIDLRQNYSRTLGQLMIDERYREHSKRRKKALVAVRKIKTIACHLQRDVEYGFYDKERLEAYYEQLWLYLKVFGLRRDSKNKIYSFHAPEVRCI
jgi:IS5 family transposase